MNRHSISFLQPDAVKNLNVQNVQYDVAKALPSPQPPARKIDKRSMLFLPSLSMKPEITQPKLSPVI